MSGIEITFKIGHSCGDQNTNDFLLLSAKHENKSEVVPGAEGQLRPIFYQNQLSSVFISDVSSEWYKNISSLYHVGILPAKPRADGTG